MTPAAPDHDIAAVAGELRAAGCVFAEAEARLLVSAAETRDDLDALVARRVSGLPLEQVLGWAEFCGLRIAVQPGVFVPRRRSELLVRQAIAVAQASEAADPGARARDPGLHARAPGPHVREPGAPASPRVVVDLCCGSGAVGVAVAAALRPAELHAADIDPAAVACARQNVAVVGGHVYEGNLYDPLPASLSGRVDVLVVNAPYVPTVEIALMPPEARLHEPRVALDGGPDGVGIQRRVAAQAPPWLAPGGHLLIETSDRQAGLTRAAMTDSGLVASVVTDDDLDATVVIGSRPR